MGKAVEFEIRIKGDDGAVRSVTASVANLGEVIAGVTDGAGRASERLRGMADMSIVLDTATRAIEGLRGMVSGVVGPYDSFDKAMRQANTMAGKSGDEFEALKGRVRGLSEEIPLAREALAGGLYETISNGVPEGNWLEFLEQSSKTAVGGLADVGQVVGVTATMIKNYGLAWESAESIQDKIQLAAKLGKTSFSELGAALPRVTGSSAQLGIAVEELLATFATTTGVTGNTAEVSTQLNAVLSALVKPTSEATAAAAAMGIEFNAASVKASGGFRNFLTDLDKSVQSYAQSSGQLPQTIYGQLFGSAEALRLLGSLTGEQRGTFEANIAAMNDSAGTMAEAYRMMSESGEAHKQLLESQTQSWLDYAGAVLSPVAPFVDLLAETGMAAMGIAQLSNLIKATVVSIRGFNAAALAAAAAQHVVAAAAKAWQVVQIALNAVLSANPIAIVVLAIAALVAGIIYAYNNCEQFREICDKVWAVIKVVAQAVWDYLVKAFEKASEVIKTAWKWVKDFFGIEDEASANDAADALNAQADGMERLGDASKDAASGIVAVGDASKDAISWQAMSYEQLGQAIENQKKKVAKLAGTNAANARAEGEKLKKMEARYKELGKTYGLSDTSSSGDQFDGKRLIENAKSYKELGNNIQYYQTKLEKTDPAEKSEIERLSKLIVGLEKQRDAIKDMQEAYSQPTELKSMDDIDKALEHQQSLLGKASIGQRAAIEAEIKRLEGLKAAFEASGHVEKPVGEIGTWDELEGEIGHYEGALKRATAQERAGIEARLRELGRLKQAWEDAADDEAWAATVAGGLPGTVRELEAAAQQCSARLKRASAEETEGIVRTRAAIEEKIGVLERAQRIAEAQVLTERLGGLEGRQLRLELELTGLSKVRGQLKELEGMLADRRNPLDEGTREKVKEQVKELKRYEAQLKLSSTGVKDAWGNVKGLGNGIKGLTSALTGDGSAWEKMTGAVDSAIGIYESAAGVIEMVKTLTLALAPAKMAEKAATEGATQATVAGAGEGIAAAGSEAAASELVATEKTKEAGAKVMAAHASIPFAGIAIAGGMVAAMVAMMLALPKFADGGIAYGPTLGLFGEYSGARTNPEVVAPLDRLRSLLGVDGGGGGGTGRVVLRVRGRDLVGVMANETRTASRSGRRSNIII